MLCTVVVAVNRMKPFTHALTPRDSWGTATSAAVSGFFYCLFATAHSVGDPYGREWGIASTVGRYETEAGVAKIVPLYRTTVGYVRLRPASKAHPLKWGGLGFAHHPAFLFSDVFLDVR